MLIGPGVFVALGETVVDHVDVVLAFSDADEIVVGLDIPMKKAARVDVLYPLDQLVCEHEHGVQAELAMAIVEQIFKTGSEKVHHECRVVAFFAAPVHFWCPQPVFKQLV